MSYEDGHFVMSMKVRISWKKCLYFYKNEEMWIFREIFEIIRESRRSNSFIQNFVSLPDDSGELATLPIQLAKPS